MKVEEKVRRGREVMVSRCKERERQRRRPARRIGEKKEGKERKTRKVQTLGGNAKGDMTARRDSERKKGIKARRQDKRRGRKLGGNKRETWC